MAETSLPIRLVPDQIKPGSVVSMSRKTAHQIDAEAADWAARFDRGPLTAGLEQEFRGWLDADMRCLGAYARIRAVALTTERARALGPDFDPDAFVATASFLPRRRVLQMGGAIAACALVGVGTAWQLARNRGRFT